MHKAGLKLPWMGRLIVTMNDDPESLRMVLDLGVSNLDKLMLLRAERTFDSFSDDEYVANELPHLCAYLRDHWKAIRPTEGIRFGVKPYHHPNRSDDS
jgi:hypothetical protein